MKPIRWLNPYLTSQFFGFDLRLRLKRDEYLMDNYEEIVTDIRNAIRDVLNKHRLEAPP